MEAATTHESGYAYPVADGTFIQLPFVYNWDDNKWQSEFSYLKEAKMRYIIASNAAASKGGGVTTCYPTKLKDCKMETEADVIGNLLGNAEKNGFKVFLGIDFNEEWWKKSRDPEWLKKQMHRDNLIACELFELYHSKYPNAFYGWYWGYEIDNLNFKTKKQLSHLYKAINMQLDYFAENKIRLPFLFSPFMNSKCSTPIEYSERWVFLFKNIHFEKGDVFCPQDSIGAGGVYIDTITEWFAGFRMAVDTKPGLRFWANTENFVISTWTSAPLNRFIKQMKLEAPYVDNIVTFAYSHYYSPNIVNDGFHKTYLDYVKTGMLDSKKPNRPESLKIRRIEGDKASISWEKARDNIGICGYEVYRNGELIFRTEATQKGGQ
ncbi:MAG: DUF4434 domain-containing protein, partial [Bacillota bacterium]|nr:DUF4434 domain-containing protein [Bacillota bacterium]